MQKILQTPQDELVEKRQIEMIFNVIIATQRKIP
jgi:hypothetical protein